MFKFPKESNLHILLQTMATNKTTENTADVTDFINRISDELKRNDSTQLVEIFEKQTSFQAKMWGASIIGFGSYHYKYPSGHEGNAPIVAFSPRAAAISLYVYLPPDQRESLLTKLGKTKSGKGCIYIKKLSHINLEVLNELIDIAVNYNKEIHG